MKINVIGDTETVLAFRLAGVEGDVVHTAADVADRVDQLFREGSGLILITENLYAQNRQGLEKRMLAPGGPLILSIPAFKGPMPHTTKASDRLAAFLKR